MAQSHFMQLKDGPIIPVKLNEWASYRRKDYVFRTKQEFDNQSDEVKAAFETEAKKIKTQGLGRKKK